MVRVSASGLCGTDYRIWSGDRPVAYPLIMGHEFIGEVAAVGAGVSTLRPGQRVAVEPNFSCGTCPLCREGNRNLCLSRTAVGIDVNGGFAEQACVPARCCWPAPGRDRAPISSCSPSRWPWWCARWRVATPVAGESAAVLGVGALGLLAIQVLKARGLRVLAVGASEPARGSGAGAGRGWIRHHRGRRGRRKRRARFRDARASTSWWRRRGRRWRWSRASSSRVRAGRVVLTGPASRGLHGQFLLRGPARDPHRRLHDLPAGVSRGHRAPLGRESPGRRSRHPPLSLERLADAFVAHRSPDAIKVSVTTLGMRLAALNGRPNRDETSGDVMSSCSQSGLSAPSPGGLFRVKAFVSRYSGAAFANRSGAKAGR